MRRFWWGLALGFIAGAVTTAANPGFSDVVLGIWTRTKAGIAALIDRAGDGAPGPAAPQLEPELEPQPQFESGPPSESPPRSDSSSGPQSAPEPAAGAPPAPVAKPRTG